ncbi:MAG: glycoside hydrolase family 38 C-terminal domain-containing protein [Chthoniobacterales bacterium]
MSNHRLDKSEIGDLVNRLEANIYLPVAEFEITAWRTKEPVSFRERQFGKELSLKPGDSWGKEIFDCAWFRFVAKIPRSCTRPLVARIDINGELCIVDACGVPVRGLTCVKSTFDPTLGCPGKTIFNIPEEWISEDRIELWAEAGWNDLFGVLVGEGRIEFAEVSFCHQDIRSLFYDFQVIADFMDGIDVAHPFFELFHSTIATAAAQLTSINTDSIAQAADTLRPLFRQISHSPPLEISAIGHSHLDLAWLWPIRETIRKGARTFATALYNIQQRPDFIFGCSQPQLFFWMKEYYPVLYAQIKTAVQLGRIEPLGTFWVEPDCNIPNGESLVRQILLGSKFFMDEFGFVPRHCWEPDVFGYNGQLPQILKKSGHDYFVTQKLSWNIVNRFPHHSFQWVGIDGTSILAHMLPEETYNSPAAPKSLRKIATEYAQKEVSRHALMVYGIGDGGGGPDAEHFERLDRERHLADLPNVVHRSAADFLLLWAKDAKEFPVWNGELYLERHQGTFTTQALTKRNNRLCETALREAEFAATLGEIYVGLPYPSERLDVIWKEVLLYQFHDILPGSSISRVYLESNARYKILLQELEVIIENRYGRLVNTGDNSGSPIAFNSLSWERKEWVKYNQNWYWADVPAMGWAKLSQPEAFPPTSFSENTIENDHLKIAFAEDGCICSIYSKSLEWEALAKNETGNQFVVFKDDGDAWDFPINYGEKDVCLYLKQPPRKLSLVRYRSFVDGPKVIMEQVYVFGESRLTQQISLTHGRAQVDFDTAVDWQSSKSMLRVRFPLAVTAAEARFEIPFGSISRSTLEADSIEKAQLEVPAQQWIGLSSEDYGAALINDCKYGFRVKGHTLDMNLLRSVPHPGKALVGKEGSSDHGNVYTDLGAHEFRYSFFPHRGVASETTLTEAARKLNVPIRIVASGNTQFSKATNLLQLSNPAIEVISVKRAERGDAWVVRLINVTPIIQDFSLFSNTFAKEIVETDLVENPIFYNSDASKDLFRKMLPFEIRTFRYSNA